MPEWEDILEGIARKALGMGAREDPPKSLEALRRNLPRLGLKLEPPSWPQGRPAPGPDWDLLGSGKGREGTNPVEGDLEVHKKLRACQERLKKKDHELQRLQGKLQRETALRQKAERERDQARQEAALARKQMAILEEELANRERELLRKGEEAERALREAEGLHKALREAKAQVEDLQAKVEELKRQLEEEKGCAKELDRLRALAETLPEPFPAEALLRVLVLDYPRFATRPDHRLLALLEGYRALKRKEVHPVLREHSNLELLEGSGEGVVLLGVKVFLEDLAGLPLDRWLRTYALRIHGFLDPGGSEKGGW
ncbi:MAG: hypothetical protein P3W93_001360 [Thermus sp.]|nr:hypothetical protein [Thermus sp.]